MRYKLAILRGMATLAAVTCVLAATACRHPCGYVDLRAQLVYAGPEAVAVSPEENPIAVVRDASTENDLLEVAIEKVEITSRPAQKTIYGREVYVPYQWYTPVAKPILAATGAVPVYSSWRDPHTHGAGNWGLLDYLRDLAAWYNFCSGIPIGPRRLGGYVQAAKPQDITVELKRRRLPMVGKTVTLHLAGEEVARKVSDDRGRVTFDMRAILVENFKDRPAESMEILLTATRPDGKEARYEWVLFDELVGHFLGKEPRKAETGELPD